MVKRKNPWWVWLLPFPVVWWAALLTAGCWNDGMSLQNFLANLSKAMNRPLLVPWTEYSVRCLLLFSLGYGVTMLVIASGRKNRRRGEEHGSAKWGDGFRLPNGTGIKRIPNKISS